MHIIVSLYVAVCGAERCCVNICVVPSAERVGCCAAGGFRQPLVKCTVRFALFNREKRNANSKRILNIPQECPATKKELAKAMKVHHTAGADSRRKIFHRSLCLTSSLKLMIIITFFLPKENVLISIFPFILTITPASNYNLNRCATVQIEDDRGVIYGIFSSSYSFLSFFVLFLNLSAYSLSTCVPGQTIEAVVTLESLRLG
eukprot:gene2130-1305_t